MKLPKIDLSSLPDLDTLTAIFGAAKRVPNPGHDDTIVVLATFLYESSPPSNFF